MKVLLIKTIQIQLKKEGLYSGKIDGNRGPKTDGAAANGLKQRKPLLPNSWKSWSSKRKFVAYVQALAKEHGIEVGLIDGWWGPQTEFAAEVLVHKITTGKAPPPWRDQTPLDTNPNNWPRQRDMINFYGSHGVPKQAQPRYIKRVDCPWKLRIAWNLNQSTSKISIHEKCADSLSRILHKVESIYGASEIKKLRLDHYGGSYVARPMRGGTAWSTHSWGIAIDWDPGRNKLKWNREQATLDNSVYDDWWKCWEEEGWLSLGRARNFDWMHVQAAKL